MVSTDLFWVSLLQVAMTSAVALMLWRVLCVLGLSYRYRLPVLALYLLYPTQVIYGQLIMAEVTLQFVLFTGLYFLMRFLETRELKYLLLLDLMLAAAPLVKPMALYFWIPNTVYHLWLAWRFGCRRIILLSLIPLAVISSWSYRNFLLTGYFHFSSIKMATMRYMTGDEREFASRPASFAEQSRALEEAFFKQKFSDLPKTMRVHAVGAIGFYLDPGRFDLYQFLGLETEKGLSRVAYGRETLSDGLKRLPPGVLIYLGCMFLLNLGIALAFCGFFIRPFTPVELKVFVLTVVLYSSFVVGPLGYSRYRLGVEPFLLLGAALWLGRHNRDEGIGQSYSTHQCQ